MCPWTHLQWLSGAAQMGRSDVDRSVLVTSEIDQSEVVQLLLQLGDLKSLGNIALLELAKTAQIESLSKGQLLSADLQLKRHLYLIDGEIELSANGRDMASDRDCGGWQSPGCAEPARPGHRILRR